MAGEIIPVARVLACESDSLFFRTLVVGADKRDRASASRINEFCVTKRCVAPDVAFLGLVTADLAIPIAIFQAAVHRRNTVKVFAQPATVLRTCGDEVGTVAVVTIVIGRAVDGEIREVRQLGIVFNEVMRVKTGLAEKIVGRIFRRIRT